MSRQLLALLGLFLATNHSLHTANKAAIRHKIHQLKGYIDEGIEIRRYTLAICNLTPAQRAAADIKLTPQQIAHDVGHIPGVNNLLHCFITELNRLRIELEK